MNAIAVADADTTTSRLPAYRQATRTHEHLLLAISNISKLFSQSSHTGNFIICY